MMGDEELYFSDLELAKKQFDELNESDLKIIVEALTADNAATNQAQKALASLREMLLLMHTPLSETIDEAVKRISDRVLKAQALPTESGSKTLTYSWGSVALRSPEPSLVISNKKEAIEEMRRKRMLTTLAKKGEWEIVVDHVKLHPEYIKGSKFLSLDAPINIVVTPTREVDGKITKDKPITRRIGTNLSV